MNETTQNLKIALASDHAGYKYKHEIAELLKSEDCQVVDFGTYSDNSVDYPDYAVPAAEAVVGGIADYGVVICGSGVGMSMVCNKIAGVRAANCCSVEMAEMSRRHNNANVINIGERFTDLATAKAMVLKFIKTEFDGGRHERRVEKIHTLTGW